MKATPYFDGARPLATVSVTRTTMPDLGTDLVIEALDEFAPACMGHRFSLTNADYIFSASSVMAR